MPDSTIFTETIYQFEILESRLRELAFLNKGIKIILQDERDGKKEEFQYNGGIKEFVQYLNKAKTPLHQEIVYFSKEHDRIAIEIAMQYNDSYNENVHSFVNNINTVEGGTHYSGFATALTRAVNDYIRKNKLTDVKLTGEDVREGLTAIISFKIPQPHF